MADVVKNDAKVATPYDEICDYLTKTAGLSTEDAKKVAALVVKLDKDLKVLDESDPDAPAVDGEYPVLEAANQALVDAVDLAVLAAKLKIDSEKFQAFVRKTNLEYLNNDLDSKMAERMEKIKKTLEKMDKAAKTALFSKIFGWLMVAVSILFAAAGGFAISAVIGVVIAVAMQVMTETGAMEKITKGLAKSLRNAFPSWSKRATEIVSAVIIAVASIVLTVVTGKIGAGFGGKLGGKISQMIAKGLKMGGQAFELTLKVVERVVNAVMKIAGHILTAVSTVMNFEFGRSQSESTLAKALLKATMDTFKTLSDELEKLIDELMNADKFFENLWVTTETNKGVIMNKMMQPI